MGMDARNGDLELPPAARQKFQELVALLAETGFGPEGPSRDTDFATIERFGHQAGQMLGRAIDVHLVARHAEHFQEEACPTCGATGESGVLEQGKTRPLQIRAAALCDDNRLESHLQNRPGNPFRLNARPHMPILTAAS